MSTPPDYKHDKGVSTKEGVYTPPCTDQAVHIKLKKSVEIMIFKIVEIFSKLK